MESSTSVAEWKVVVDDLEIEFEIDIRLSQSDENFSPKLQEQISKGIMEVDEALDENSLRLKELNAEIDRLTNHADGLDYAVAVGSGVLAAIVDSFWVGEFDLTRGKNWGSDQVNSMVSKVARFQGYQGDDLSGAIKFLEEKFKIPSDGNFGDFGGALLHHLNDFAHHPTLVGLFFSLLTQFTGNAYGTNAGGVFQVVPVKDRALIGRNLPEKMFFGVTSWFFHLVSDMAGSSAYAGGGTGIPGPLLSLAKEVSALPLFKNARGGKNSLSEWLSEVFKGNALSIRDGNGDLVRFDLRAEIGLAYELGRQAVPVILNECIVRGFYFIRRLSAEIKEKNISRFEDLRYIDWKKTLPFKNRTIVRMLTISTTTFTLLDFADATVRSAFKSGGNLAVFMKGFLLRVNFVGVGRCALAIGTDVAMGIKRSRLRNQRIKAMSRQIHLLNAKVFYLQADAWVAAENTERTISEAMELMEKAAALRLAVWQQNQQSLEEIGRLSDEVEMQNPGLIDEINDILKWG